MTGSFYSKKRMILIFAELVIIDFLTIQKKINIIKPHLEKQFNFYLI